MTNVHPSTARQRVNELINKWFHGKICKISQKWNKYLDKCDPQSYRGSPNYTDSRKIHWCTDTPSCLDTRGRYYIHQYQNHRNHQSNPLDNHRYQWLCHMSWCWLCYSCRSVYNCHPSYLLDKLKIIRTN